MLQDLANCDEKLSDDQLVIVLLNSLGYKYREIWNALRVWKRRSLTLFFLQIKQFYKFVNAIYLRYTSFSYPQVIYRIHLDYKKKLSYVDYNKCTVSWAKAFEIISHRWPLIPNTLTYQRPDTHWVIYQPSFSISYPRKVF